MEQRKRKVALITGGAKGIGKMTAVTLAQMGCDIAINYLHSAAEAADLAISIEAEYGVRAIAVQGDITIREHLERLIAETEKRLDGGVDILINNAGPFIRERRLFADYNAEEIETLIRGNLLAAILLDSLVLPHMRQMKWGRIIHYGFGHAAEARGWVHRAVYAAAKVGLVSFTKTLAEEEAISGITVNMICPGDIRGANKEKKLQDARSMRDDETPVGRPGTGEDVARIVGFLCREESDFITGSMIDVTGGLDPIQTMPALKRR